MIRNYLVSAFRILTRHPGYATINLLGLSVGVAACLLIILFVRNELSFDAYHQDSDHIYRAAVSENYGGDQHFFNTTTPVPLAPGLKASIPEVESAVRLSRFSDKVSREDVSLSEIVYLADSDFFDVFDFQFISGTPETALREPHNVLLSEAGAVRYFGETSPIGKSLLIPIRGEAQEFMVSAVIANPPANSSIRFDVLIPYTVLEQSFSERMRTQSWFNVSVETYVRLRDDATPAVMKSKLTDFVTNALGDRVAPGQYSVILQPLKDIHLNPEFPRGFAPVGNPVYVRVLAIIAGLILLIACINFVTLSISRSISRSLEVGVRKTMGASRGQLMRQYWGEAFGFALLSLAFGTVMSEVFLPAFNRLANTELSLSADAITMIILLALFGAIGIMAGVYPAFVLSGFNPTDIFQKKILVRGDRSIVRKTLVISQFALSIVLLAGTMLIQNQLNFVVTKDLGYNHDQVIVIPTDLPLEDVAQLGERLRFEFAGSPLVESVSTVRHAFSSLGWTEIGYQADDGVYRGFAANFVDADYLNTLRMRLKNGRGFSKDIPSDEGSAIIVNEAFVREYGWDDPIGQHIPGNFAEHEVIGVVEDFNFESLHSRMRPVVLAMSDPLIFSGASDVGSEDNSSGKILIRTRGSDAALAEIQAAWNRTAPEIPFNYSFMTAALEKQYGQERQLKKIASAGSFLALFIAALGLFGLAALATQRRTKEVGIRRVLGASTGSIVLLFGKDFSRLILIAFVLATPITYALNQRWLDSFAYQTGPAPWSFIGAGLAAFLIMWLAVGYQSLRAARLNPSASLRTE